MYPSTTPFYGNQFNQGNYGFTPQVPVQPKQEIIRVHGEEGAKAYQLPPNSSILLLDDANPILWFKSTDGAGYPTVIPYDIVPHAQQQEIAQPTYDYNALEERISRLERRLNNGKSYSGNARQAQAARPASPAKPAEAAESVI